MQIDDSLHLLGLAEEYREALAYYHSACAEEALRTGQPPMTLAETVQVMIYNFFADAAKRDEEALTAFELILAPQFLGDGHQQPEAAVTATGENDKC